ncbi:hypothetical protein EGW08_022374, partial [Elysia chlorotica]
EPVVQKLQDDPDGLHVLPVKLNLLAVPGPLVLLHHRSQELLVEVRRDVDQEVHNVATEQIHYFLFCCYCCFLNINQCSSTDSVRANYLINRLLLHGDCEVEENLEDLGTQLHLLVSEPAGLGLSVPQGQVEDFHQVREAMQLVAD